MNNNNQNNFFNANFNNPNFNNPNNNNYQQYMRLNNPNISNNILNRPITPEFYHYMNHMYYSTDLLRNVINIIENNNNNLFYFAYNSLNNQFNSNNNFNSPYYQSQQNANASPLRYNEFNSPERENSIHYDDTNNNDVNNNDEVDLNEYESNIVDNNETTTQYSNELQQQFQNILQQILQQARERDNAAMYNYMLENCIHQLHFNEIENPINNECPILQSEFEEDDVVVQLNRCSHIFNADAIKNWLRNNHTCPVCRCNLIQNTNYQRSRSYSFYF